jgi:hypothetical protein
MDYTQYNRICEQVWYNDDTKELESLVKEIKKAGVDKDKLPVLGQWREDKQTKKYIVTVGSIKAEILKEGGGSEKLKRACERLFEKQNG